MKAAPDSLNAKLREFFDANPTEMLTFQDIEDKFDASKITVKGTLQSLRKQGVIRLDYVVMSSGSPRP